MINIINFINILQKKKRKKMHKNVSLPRERERERLLIPRINPSSIRLEKNKEKEERGRIILT